MTFSAARRSADGEDHHARQSSFPPVRHLDWRRWHIFHRMLRSVSGRCTEGCRGDAPRLSSPGTYNTEPRCVDLMAVWLTTRVVKPSKA